MRSDRAHVLCGFLRFHDGWGLERLLVDHGLLGDALAIERVAAVLELEEEWRRLQNIVPQDDSQVQRRFEAARLKIRAAQHVRGRVLDSITEGDVAQLANGKLRFPDRHSLWTQIHEILANEDYYFECETDSPRILDCGTHLGMSIYYFKNLYPGARILGFEPMPELREMAIANVQINGYADVEILPYALSDSDGPKTFHASDTYSMAGSLLPRRKEAGDETREIAVECRRLSEYLQEPVHFLKMDIEGSEDVVLEEAAKHLGNVQHLFCECHEGLGLKPGRLSKIVHLLERAGFDVHVGKSHNFQRTSKSRPMTFVDGPASELIWAKNRRRN